MRHRTTGLYQNGHELLRRGDVIDFLDRRRVARSLILAGVAIIVGVAMALFFIR